MLLCGKMKIRAGGRLCDRPRGLPTYRAARCVPAVCRTSSACVSPAGARESTSCCSWGSAEGRVKAAPGAWNGMGAPAPYTRGIMRRPDGRHDGYHRGYRHPETMCAHGVHVQHHRVPCGVSAGRRPAPRAAPAGAAGPRVPAAPRDPEGGQPRHVGFNDRRPGRFMGNKLG